MPSSFQMDFKPTFISLKLTHLTPPFSGDFSTVNAVSGDDFSVEDLLNFPTDANFLQENRNPQAHATINDEPTIVSPAKTSNDGETTVPESELRLPVNDVGDLEWVSQFVDDSFSGDFLLPFLARKLPEMSPSTETETVTLVDVNPSFGNSVNKRVRSKRRRTGGRFWSLRSSSPATDCSTTSSSSTSSCTSKPLLFADDVLGEPAVQVKRRRVPATVGGSGRRCSHCLVQKTPQWRTGPLGAKTLCNACGVRFKSGRLLPEYRPACSPTFSSEMHSNNHRKVLEMRRKKAVEMVGCGGLTGSD